MDWVALAARSDIEFYMKRGADFLKVSSNTKGREL